MAGFIIYKANVTNVANVVVAVALRGIHHTDSIIQTDSHHPAGDMLGVGLTNACSTILLRANHAQSRYNT